ncbi:MAG: methionyl-tRNA formyltransferase [Erysipelotrichaceae bacterium]|nr:methionyl-tRNA formyltransferase [Erysipelotrichaceae bacterium]
MSNLDKRIVFMGTPVFGREILRTLVENGYNVVGAVTQPDKLTGRKQTVTFSEVKQYALEKGIEVLQPVKIRREYQPVLDLNPDLIVTCAYGQIIPDELLNAPPSGCINVHASLLPKLRGGAPIQHAIIDGYEKTGITIMEMASRMDAGAIISQCEVEIGEEEHYGSLHDRLIIAAQQLLLDTMDSVLDHSYVAVEQNEEEVTYGYNISREEERIDFTGSYQQVFDQIRGLSPQPCAYTTIAGKKVKICSVRKSDFTCDRENGTIVFIEKSLGVVVDKRIIIIDTLQPEGKALMSCRDCRNGAGRNWDGETCS